MSDNVERAAAILQARMSWPKADACAQDLDRAKLLAAPIDSDLREALAIALQIPVHDSFVCASDCGDDISTYPPVPPPLLDAIMPVVTAHVVDQERKLREEIATEIRALEIIPRGRFSERDPWAMRERAARVARGE